MLPQDVRMGALVLGGAFLFMTLWFAVEEYFSRRKIKTYLAIGKGVRIINRDKQT